MRGQRSVVQRKEQDKEPPEPLNGEETGGLTTAF